MSEIIHEVLQFITGLGYWGILLGLAIEIIPSEIVLAYAGYLVYLQQINTVEAVIYGTAGCLVQQIVLYWIGRFGGRPFVDKYGKYLHLKKHHIDITERWFQKYGAGVVFTARFVPVLRQAISIPAGIARMSLFKFLLYTGLASIPWAVLFITLGKTLGENWETIDDVAGQYTKPILWAAIGLTAAYFIWKELVKRGAKDKAGYVGEKNVAHQLKFIGSEYKVFNGRHVRARTGSQEIDHLVVGPNGVFHIETKNWGGEIRFTASGVERSKEGHHEDPTAQLYRHEFVLKELLRGNKLQADVVGILCFSNPQCTLVGGSPAFATVKLDRLVHAIKTYQPKKLLTRDEVKAIAGLIERHSVPSR